MIPTEFCGYCFNLLISNHNVVGGVKAVVFVCKFLMNPRMIKTAVYQYPLSFILIHLILTENAFKKLKMRLSSEKKKGKWN